MSNELVKMEYQDIAVTFNESAWFNATEVADRFGKRPVDWLRQVETKRYMESLCRRYEVRETHFVRTKRGGDVGAQGTWLHPKLAVAFARWLDLDFSIWCDEQIDGLLRGNHPHCDWKRSRHEAASSYKVACQILQMTREDIGKTTAPHHFSNEARMINHALTGTYGKVDREGLSQADLDLLAKLENLDTVLIGKGVDYEARKMALEKLAHDKRILAIPVLKSA